LYSEEAAAAAAEKHSNAPHPILLEINVVISESSLRE
jgi:hypothetical protein